MISRHLLRLIQNLVEKQKVPNKGWLLGGYKEPGSISIKSWKIEKNRPILEPGCQFSYSPLLKNLLVSHESDPLRNRLL